MLFSVLKCNASLGRSTTSRKTIKERKSVVRSPLQQPTAVRQRSITRPQQTSDMVVELRNATINVTHKSYVPFEAEFLEKEQQKTAFFEVRIIRDNLLDP